jgi:hypothetical protein
VLRMAATDPTFPINRKLKPNIVMQDDLETWVRRGYSESAKRMLRGEPDPDGAAAIAARELEELLADRPRRRRRTPQTP